MNTVHYSDVIWTPAERKVLSKAEWSLITHPEHKSKMKRTEKLFCPLIKKYFSVQNCAEKHLIKDTETITLLHL